MADKKVDAATGEVRLERGPALIDGETLASERKELFDPDDQDGELFMGIKVHCKPVYNYQSVEFDWVIPYNCDKECMDSMEAFYTKMLEMLIRVSQKALQAETKKPAAPVEEPASEAQKQILRNFHIDFKPDITKKQAHALIKKSMDQEIF